MGKQAVEILNLEVPRLVQMLNEALAEEWLAYYQYWIGSQVMEGPMRSDIEPELMLHATQELGHALQVSTRIIQLRGVPLTDPKQWFEYAKCAYEAPNDPYIEKILEQNLRGERCAIARYQSIANFTNGVDHVTHQMATTILTDEIEHEREIEDWIADIVRMKEELRKFRV